MGAPFYVGSGLCVNDTVRHLVVIFGNTLLEGVCIRLTRHLHNHDMTHVMNMKEVLLYAFL